MTSINEIEVVTLEDLKEVHKHAKPIAYKTKHPRQKAETDALTRLEIEDKKEALRMKREDNYDYSF